MTRQSTSTKQPPSPPQFVLFTTPLPLSCLDADSRTCPICRQQYIDFPSSGQDPADSESEWAVRVDIAAAIGGRTRCCGHIFGRRCLEKHVKSSNPWHNKCPICRSTWFTYADPVQHPAPATASPENANPPTRPRMRSRASHAARSVLRTRRRDGSTRSSRPHLHRSANFIQRVLETFEVQEGSDEVKASVEEVEQTLQNLYRNFEGGR